jgi:polyisoprenoid-binding protein YceI
MTWSTPTTSPAEHLQSGDASGVWQLDPATSSITFAVKHFWGLMTVKGRFGELEGTVEVSESGAIRGSLAVRAESLDTGIKKRDKHLRSAAFFHVGEHPTITFRIDDVVMVDPDLAHVTGALKAAGESQPVRFDARLETTAAGISGSDRAIVDARAVVDRTKHGMTWSPMRMAAKMATVTLHLVFARS